MKNNRLILALASLLFAGLLSTPHCIYAFEVPIILEEPAGIDRLNELACGGIPIPAETIKDIQQLSLWDGKRLVPAQITPLVRDEKGFIRWILVSLIDDLHGYAKKNFTLKRSGGSPLSDTQLSVEETEDRVKLDTGRISFAVSKKAFRLFEYVNVEGRQVISGTDDAMTLETMDKKVTYRAGRPARIEWEQHGPLVATLFVRGFYVDKAGKKVPGVTYTIRMTTWAGSSKVFVSHEIGNSNPDMEQYLVLRQANIRVSMPRAVQVKDYSHWVEINGGGKDTVAVLIRHEGLFDEKKVNELDFRKARLKDGVVDISVIPMLPDDIEKRQTPIGYGANGGYLLHDLTHKGTEVVFDFGKGDPDSRATACNAGLHLRAPGQWYAMHDGMGVGNFGTVGDEAEAYKNWKWSGWNDESRRQDSPKSKWRKFQPDASINYANTHNITEADEARGMIQQYLRTGSRGFYDYAEAWVRYQKTHYAYRTDDYNYSGGGTHFNQWRPSQKRAMGKSALKEQLGNDLWRTRARALQGKYESCHAYGEGLLNWYLITGDRSALEAAKDIGEVIEKEPGGGAGKPGLSRPTRWGARTFGRQFGIVCRLYAATRDKHWKDLMNRMGQIALMCPDLDERAFFEAWNPTKRAYRMLERCQSLLSNVSDDKSKPTLAFAEYVNKTGIQVEDAPGGWIIGPNGNRWHDKWIGGTWMQSYLSAALGQYWQYTQDEDARDLLIAMSYFTDRYLLYRPCGYIPYNVYLDFPLKDDVIRIEGPVYWTEEHCGGQPRSGRHQGWYTWHFVDTVVRGYMLSGDSALLDTAKTLWNNGSKRLFYSEIKAGDEEVYRFVSSNPRSSKSDQASQCTLLFYPVAHPRMDNLPPEKISDLEAHCLEGGGIKISFTAPKDRGGGKIVEYQAKYSDLPILDYREWNYSKHDKIKRNWWRATNIKGEPNPKGTGEKVEFIAMSIPGGTQYFYVRSFDNSANRSELSNGAVIECR